MASQIRNYIAKKILQSAEQTHIRAALASQIRIGTLSQNKESSDIKCYVPHDLYDTFIPGKSSENTASQLLHEFEPCDVVRSIELRKNVTVVGLQNDFFTELIIDDILNSDSNFGINSSIFANDQTGKQKVIVEYSSPNIAKPFHAGHLRSTIIGNFIANIHEAKGHHVRRLNYLGDWGTQFGLLGVGLKKYGSDTELETNPMQHLFEIYVRMNAEMELEEQRSDTPQKTPLLKDQALRFFHKMEQGDQEALRTWETCRNLSIKEYNKTYKRLGVSFDEYQGEAMYYKQSLDIVEQLRKRGLLQTHSERGVEYIDLDSVPGMTNKYATLVKSDGTTLYITREIAAALDRKKNHEFDQMFYVVENGQHLHFQQLFGSLHIMGHPWASDHLTHAKFGRIEGMSSRKGTVVFLDDILNEARNRMLENMKEKHTTKVHDLEEREHIADILGMSAVIIQDLKEHRLRNYKFSWRRMLSFEGDTGIFLQYTYARLCSLIAYCGTELNLNCDKSCLYEDTHALRILTHLARYDEVLLRSYTDLEACYVVNYAFTLCREVNRALRQLRIKDEQTEVAEARLLLFYVSKTVLKSALEIIGLRPVNQM